MPALFLVMSMVLLPLQGAPAQMKGSDDILPDAVDAWTRSERVRHIDSETIFDYMNGAGELYIGYRFDHLEVYEYAADGEPGILAELYYMETSDDAFGLLSLDWGGEPVVLTGTRACRSMKVGGGARGSTAGDAAEADGGGPGSTVGSNESWMAVPQSRALYGAGLLRIWTADIYARVLTERETPESREAVLEIGRAITAGRDLPPQPELIEVLKPALASDWHLKMGDIRYLRSYLVLNSAYYLSNENLLDLDHSTEAVTAPYVRGKEDGGGHVRLLIVKYPDGERAARALARFHEIYLEGQKSAGFESDQVTCFEIEDGWLGYGLIDSYGALVFECPDRESCSGIIEEIGSNLRNKEGDHGG